MEQKHNRVSYASQSCSECGANCSGAPSFSFAAPYFYSVLSEKDREQSMITSDLCVVLNQDFFIRAVLEIPIIGHDEPFCWGVWVSQSLDNFEYYREHFDEELSGRQTFGWFSNQLPYYDETLGLKTMVHFQDKGFRPKLCVEESDHQLSKDHQLGISAEKALEIAEIVTRQSEKQ